MLLPHLSERRADQVLAALDATVNLPGYGKLTDEQRHEIRTRVARGERQIDMAREFNVSKGTISGIVNRTREYADA